MLINNIMLAFSISINKKTKSNSNNLNEFKVVLVIETEYVKPSTLFLKKRRAHQPQK